MKKIDRRFLVVLMTTSLALGCMGCGSDKDDRKDDDQGNKAEETEIVDEEEETEAEVEETETEATEEPTTATESIASIEIGDTVSNDTVEYTLTNVEFKDKIVPPDPPSYYTYYQAPDGEDYFLLEADVKNISNTAFSVDAAFMEVLLVYNDTYEYDSRISGFTLTIDSDGDFYYFSSSLSPLSSEHMYYLITVPEEVTGSDGTLVAYITLYGGGEYVYTIR